MLQIGHKQFRAVSYSINEPHPVAPLRPKPIALPQQARRTGFRPRAQQHLARRIASLKLHRL
jgi:hypothetical protein